MALHEDFIEAVNSGNKNKVRIMIKDSFMIDPSMRTLNEMLSFAERGIAELYEASDGASLNNDKVTWDEKYFNAQLTDLLFNFSRERIAHLIKICEYHYDGRLSSKSARNTHRQRPSDDERKRSSSDFPQREVGTIAAVAGVAATIGGFIISKPLLIAAGIASTVIGGIMVVTDREDEQKNEERTYGK